MDKLRGLLIDFDSTLVPTIEVLCDMYNAKYSYHSEFKPANPLRVKRWDMTDECPLLDQETMEDWFDSDEFFERAYPFEDAINVINTLHHKHKLEIVFVSRGTCKNIAKKSKMLNRLFSYCTQIPVIAKWDKRVDKSLINADGYIFIDDVAKNLETSNASYKLLYSENGNYDTEWAKTWRGDRVDNYMELYYKVLEYKKDFEGDDSDE